MQGLYSTLLFLHLTADVIWIGSILAVAVALNGPTTESQTRGQIALEIYKKLSVPAFVAAFSAGTLRLVLSLDYYFLETKFMHGKLLLVVLIVAIHHMIGGRAKKVARGTAIGPGSSTTLSIVLLISAVGTVFLAVLKPF